MIFKPYFLLAAMTLCAPAARSQPITDAQALAAGHTLETAINSGNSYAIDHFLYLDSLLERLRQKSQYLKDPNVLKGFKSTFVPAMNKGNLGKQVLAVIHNGNYRLLREFDQGGRKHLLFRMFGDGGLGYQDFILIRVGDSIGAADIFNYSTDEWLSSSIARVTDMFGLGSDPMGDIGILKKMTEQLNSSEYTDVKTAFEGLAPQYKKSKSIQMIYISACHHIDLGLYEQALEGYAKTFPDATGSYLMMLDLYYLKKEYDKELDCLDKLDKLIGGDTLLDNYRAIAYTAMDKKAEALTCYENIYRYDPTLKINVLRLTAAYAAAGQKDKARKVIAAYMETPGYHIGDLNPVYERYPDLK
ncbi:MAG TPA: hypothetical protein VGS79_24300 [Puia sp.]|nr:hypothetical protein [Puia sp.]